MAFLRSVLFAMVFGVGTVVYVLLTVAAVPFGRSAMRRWADRWAAFYLACARVLLGIGLKVEGAVPEGGVLIAARHESMYETMAMPVVLSAPAMVMKRELARIPVWGWLARRYGIIPIDRDGGAAALRKMLKAAQDAIDDGRPILIFPEGTRVAPRARPPLQPGFAGLYRALGVPVVPVAVSSGRVWRRGRFVKHPGTIVLSFGDPLPPGLPRKEIEAKVHEAIGALG